MTRSLFAFLFLENMGYLFFFCSLSFLCLLAWILFLFSLFICHALFLEWISLHALFLAWIYIFSFCIAHIFFGKGGSLRKTVMANKWSFLFGG